MGWMDLSVSIQYRKPETNGPRSPTVSPPAVLGMGLAGGEHPGKSFVRGKNGSKTCETGGSADYGTKGPLQLHHSTFFQSLLHGEQTRDLPGCCSSSLALQMPASSHKALSSHEK